MAQRLVNASRENSLRKVQKFLQMGMDVHFNDDEALIRASQSGNLEIVQLLLEHGANVHARNNLALRYCNHASIAKLLLAYGADVQATNNVTLKTVISDGNVSLALVLLEYGANVYTVDESHLRRCIFERADGLSIMKLLIEKGIMHTRLMNWVCEYGNVELAQLLIEKGVDIHYRGIDAPLLNACRGGHISIVRLFVENGVNIYNFTHCPLDIAREYKKFEVVKLLNEFGMGKFTFDIQPEFTLSISEM